MTLETNRRVFMSGVAAGLALVSGVTAFATKALAASTSASYGANSLDIHLPSNPQNAPVLAYVHGGAWKMGNKSKIGSKPDYYTAKAFIVVSIGYSLYPSANAEQQAVQISQAVNWLSVNIGKFGGDGSRIALMGHSAGCHLAAMATLSGACNPKLLICNDTGAYDVAYLAELNNGRVPSLYSALDTKSKWARWSPISYVKNRRQPPVLVMWSGGRNRDKVRSG